MNTIRASIVDALLCGACPAMIASRHNVPVSYVAAIAQGIKRRFRPKPRAKQRPKRRLIKAAGC